MKKKENYICAFEYAMDCINGKWKGKILKYLNDRTYRFNELHKAIPGITQKMLSQMLKELEQDNIIIRKSFQVIPPKVEYSLSEEGKKLEKIFYLLGEWGENLAIKNDIKNIKCIQK